MRRAKMGLFNMKKKKAEKEAARAAEVQRAAEALNQQKARAATTQLAAKRAKADQNQDIAITERKAVQEKITLWEKKVAKLENDKKIVLTRMSEANKKGLRMSDVDKRKLAKVKRDIQLTQGQLETLQNKLSNIEMAASNAQITDTISSANTATAKIAKPVEEVAAVLEEAENQQKDLEEANVEFMINANSTAIDDDDILEDLAEFETELAYEQGAAAPAAASSSKAGAAGIPSVPTVQPNYVPKPAEPDMDDELEAELRRHELKGQAA